MRNTANFVSETQDTEGEAITARPSATALFAVDSDDRYATYQQRRNVPTYPFSFNIQKNESLLNGFFKRLALTEFRMNWTLPNISKAWGNNQIVFNYITAPSGTKQNITITLQDGFYTSQLLAYWLSLEIQTVVPNFEVFISNFDENRFFFLQPPDTTGKFMLSPVPNQSQRQLIDMLNVPNPTADPTDEANYKTSVFTGIPNLRAMDYFDIVSAQLSYNQELKDSTSAPITRDCIARIYLDQDVPSYANFETKYFAGTGTGTTTQFTPLSAELIGDVVRYRVSTAPTGLLPGTPVVVSGITVGIGFNGSAVVVGTDTATPFHIDLAYKISPSGTPTIPGTARITAYTSLVQTSYPQTTWDDRVNGITPFTMYRQFPYPKQIRWSNKMPIGNLTFELYDDQGRSIQDLWNVAYPVSGNLGFSYANSFVWNASMLVSED
jgi:hypothetical protein